METHVYKNIEFWKWNPPATPEQIAAAERELGGNFPTDFRDLLLNTNGGRVKNNLDFKTASHDVEPRVRSVMTFYGVGSDVNGFILNELAGYDFVERVPDLIIPIAKLVSDFKICISLRQHDKGSIYMWGPLHLWATPDDGPNEKNDEDLFFLAKSFTEFLAMLKPMPE